jgi:hypothetical protein
MIPRPPVPEAGPPPTEGYAFLEHTADIGILAWAPSFPGVIVQALMAMASLMFPTTQVDRVETHLAAYEAPDPLSAVVQALNELLFLVDTEGFLLATAVADVTGGSAPLGPGQTSPAHPKDELLQIALCLTGDRLSSPLRDYSVITGVKAATYGDAGVGYVPARCRWEATLTLDV